MQITDLTVVYKPFNPGDNYLYLAPDLLKARRCPDERHWIHRADGKPWKSSYYVSKSKIIEHIWVGAEDSETILKALTKWHLFLEAIS